MIMARVIILGIVVVVSMLVAYIFRNVTGSVVTVIQSTFSDMGLSMSTFETAIVILMPYIALVYLAIVRPIVDFWQTRRN